MSNDPRQQQEPVGRMRTMWHLILYNLLAPFLRGGYRVDYQLNVGREPLRIDYFLARRGDGEVPPRARSVLAGMLERLNEFTLVELKAPNGDLAGGDFRKLLAYLHLWVIENDVELDPERLSVMVIAPRLAGTYADELRRCGVQVTLAETGVHRLTGGMLGRHPGWVLETAHLADTGHPCLALMSPVFLRQPRPVYNAFEAAGFDDIARYVMQQIQQFQTSEGLFAMQHADVSEELREFSRQFMSSLTPADLVDVPPEVRVAGVPPEVRVAGVPPEVRVAGVPPEVRVRGLSPDELLASLTPEQRQAIARALAQSPPPP